MGKKYKFLAFDFGASSGRAMLATFDGEKITLEEKHRFSNDPVNINGDLHWDVLRLFFEIKQGILKCANSGDRDIDCIGIDTWGVDYGLLDENDKLIGNPYHYRDTRTEGMYDEAFKLVPKEEIFKETGIAFNWFNTIYQLLSAKLSGDTSLKNAKTLLMMPDLFNFFLTGVKKTEYTNASTTQMYNSEKYEWSYDLLKKLGIPTDILTDVIFPGEIVGKVKPELAEELGIEQVPVVAVASHDTGSAVASVPVVDQKDFIYISSGTWSLMGVELDKPNTSDGAFNHNFTNEGGYEYRYRFLKNIMGLWMIQSVKKEWKESGEDYSFGEICKRASRETISSIVDCNDSRFLAPESMCKAVKTYCEESGQQVPETKWEMAAVIYNSLADCYRICCREIEALTGVRYDCIHIVGGGANADYLNRLTAEATGKTVYAGPTEATAIGNLAVQMIEGKEFKSLKEARDSIFGSFEIKTYEPSEKVC